MIALALIALSVLGVARWLKRRPAGRLAPPPRGGDLPTGFKVAVLVCGLLLPLFGLSMMVVLLIERLRARFALP